MNTEGEKVEKEIKDNYLEAGRINKKIIEYARSYVKEGKSLLDIAEALEKKISEENKEARPAWPVNLSINENAAHQTASLDEEVVLTGNELLKIDAGVHIDGYISDAAITIDLSGEHGKLVEAAEEALEEGVKAAEKREISAIGKAIEKAIKDKGFNPVQNLTGHFLEQWINHEPFGTDGEGYVREGGKAEVFMLIERKPLRNINARKILDFIEENYNTLPFAERWLTKEFEMPDFQRKVAFRELVRGGCLKSFPVLHEEKGKLVAQAETTLIIEDGEITRLV